MLFLSYLANQGRESSSIGDYMFKVPSRNLIAESNNRNSRAKYEICSKLTIKIPERLQTSF